MTGQLVSREAFAVELVSPAEELVETFVLSLGAAGSSTTVRTYAGAVRRYVRWVVEQLGPDAGAAAFTLATVTGYENAMAADGLAMSTIKKERSAINKLIAFLGEHELIEPAQARLALSRRLPSPESGERERPKALSDEQYRRLLTEAEATVARDPLLGRRDVALIRVLGDAGLRIEELLALDREDFLPTRKGANLRTIRVRHGKGNRRRKVELTPAATEALRRWDELRVQLGPPPDQPDLEPAKWPMFVTIGRRRSNGSYTRLPARPTRSIVDDLLKRLGRKAGIPEDLRHAHTLRHTFATRFYRRTGRVAELQRLLGHGNPKTTMIYVDDDPSERERLMLQAAAEPATFDVERALVTA